MGGVCLAVIASVYRETLPGSEGWEDPRALTPGGQWGVRKELSAGCPELLENLRGGDGRRPQGRRVALGSPRKLWM